MTPELLTLEGLPTPDEIEEELELRDLVRFVPRMSPRYMAPTHLAPLLRRFEAAVDGVPQRVCCSAPPRHAKSESVFHVPAFALRRRPDMTLSYSTYGDRLSRKGSRKARALVHAAGIQTGGTINEWRTPEGGGLLAGGVGGPLTGFGVDLAIVDDPIKNRIEAESATHRARLSDWVRDVLLTRIEPGGSVFVFMTRWHTDDLIGELIREGFEYLNFPALSDEGEALWPERWGADAMRARREEVGEYTWASLYQGQPRARGGRVFGDVHTYSELPRVFRGAFGLDVSYSSKTSSDYTVTVRMLRAGDLYFVVDCQRWQLHPTASEPRLKALADAHPSEPWRWYLSGTEQGSAGFLRAAVPKLQARPAVADKFVRAIKYAAAWNAGKVLLPESAPWLDVFVSEHAGFTGVNDTHDDIIDAAVAAFDVLSATPGGGPIGSSVPEPGNRMTGL